MSAFDYHTYRAHLAQARLDLAIVFSPSAHPRGTGGLFVTTGQQGQHVQQLQSRLADQGSPIKPDGIFGSQTQAAVVAFQKANGLTVDGVVGRQTAAALLGEKTQTPGALSLKQAKLLGLPTSMLAHVASQVASRTATTKTTKTRKTSTKPKGPVGTTNPQAALAALIAAGKGKK